MIDYLVHLYKCGTEPFRTLSVLPEEDAIRIMQSLYMEGSIFWERFADPAAYLRLRKQIEESIRAAFMVKGGRPQETHPIYMAFGKSRWMLHDIDALTLATTTEIVVPLSLFEECDVSFTYPDSMVSFILADQKESEYYLPDYHGKVFTLCEVSSIVELKGLPGEKWGIMPTSMPNYIEAQVWNHKPLLEYKRHLDTGSAQFPSL